MALDDKSRSIIDHNNNRIVQFCKSFSPRIPIVLDVMELSKYPCHDQHVYFGSFISKDTVLKISKHIQSSSSFIVIDGCNLSLDELLMSNANLNSLVPTRFESMIMESIRSCKDPEFKSLLGLAKDRAPN